MGVHRTPEVPGGGLGTLEEEEEEDGLGIDGLQHYPHRHHSPTSSTNSDVLNNNQLDGDKGKHKDFLWVMVLVQLLLLLPRR